MDDAIIANRKDLPHCSKDNYFSLSLTVISFNQQPQMSLDEHLEQLVDQPTQEFIGHGDNDDDKQAVTDRCVAKEAAP